MGGDGGRPLHHGLHRQERRPVSFHTSNNISLSTVVCKLVKSHPKAHQSFFVQSEEHQANPPEQQGATVARKGSFH